MTLTERLTGLKGRLTKLPKKFGIPRYRDVVIRKKIATSPNIGGLINHEIEDVLIDPTPRVENVTPKLVEVMNSENVEIGLDDFRMKVVRTFDLPEIKDIEFVIVDPIFDDSNCLIGGIKTKIIHISDKKTTDYITFLRRMTDNKIITSAKPITR